jgi:uncharacterized cupredoxin-like copper-binding protein
MHVQSIRQAVVAFAAIALALTGCTSGATTGPTSAATGGTAATGGMPATVASGNVDITLQEWAVVPASTSAAAGDVTFKITNTGPEDEHEFVVIKSDLDPGALPTEASGAVDEAGAGIEVIDEVEEIPVGGSQDLTVDLAAGNYVFICNILDEDENESHYQMGMRIGFTVE